MPTLDHVQKAFLVPTSELKLGQRCWLLSTLEVVIVFALTKTQAFVQRRKAHWPTAVAFEELVLDDGPSVELARSWRQIQGSKKHGRDRSYVIHALEDMEERQRVERFRPKRKGGTR